MKLSTKLVLSFSIVVVLVGGIGITSSYINEAVKDQVTAESEQAIDEIELAGEMAVHLYQSLTRTQYLLEDRYRQSLSMNYNRGNRTKKTLKENINESLQKFQQSTNESRKRIRQEPSNFIIEDTTSSSDVLQLLNKLEKKFSIYSSLLNQFQSLSSESYEDGKEFFTVTIEPYFRTNLLPLIEEVRTAIQTNHQQGVKHLNSQLSWVGNILMFATVLSLLIAISITFFLYRSLANPIKKIATAAKSIGQGNLDERINYSSNDELGQLSSTFDHMAESLSKTTVSRDYVDSIIEAMADLLVVTDENYNITRVNSAGIQMLNSTEDEILGQHIDTIFNNLPDKISKRQANGNVKNSDSVLVSRDGDEIPVSISKGTIKNSSGTTDGYVILASDISAEKEAQQKIAKSLKEKEVMLAEIHHRVKNNLAVIAGLLEMQIWEAESDLAASALKQSRLRVQSIALVHEKLYQTESLSFIEFDQYVQDLLEGIHGTYSIEESNIEITTELERIVLNINQAIPCSLLINELVVNSLKHGFEDGQEGNIKVLLKEIDKQVNVIVKDNGKGFSEEEDPESVAITLVKTLAKQLDGTVTFKNENGANISVLFKAEEVLNT